MADEQITGFLICSGNSKRQINQFKRLFIRDNLKNESNPYLQMRKSKLRDDLYTLTVTANKKQLGIFFVIMTKTSILSINDYSQINKLAETLFREETVYGISDWTGLDRLNQAIISGFGDVELYPTITIKAAALWYKIASNQVFRNGNKRTALIAAITFLNLNFYSFDAHDGNEMYDISVRAANHEISIPQIEKYIKNHVSLNYNLMNAMLNGDELEVSHHIDFHNTRE